MEKQFVQEGSQFIIHTQGPMCTTTQELLNSPLFQEVLLAFIQQQIQEKSPLLKKIPVDLSNQTGQWTLLSLLQYLATESIEDIVRRNPMIKEIVQNMDRVALWTFVEKLYDFWRGFDRFIVCHSENSLDGHDRRPYRTFNAIIENLTHIIRAAYRDICENITGDHPRIYRQVSAGCDAGLIAVPKEWPITHDSCSILNDIAFIRQVLIYPPLIIDPPMNKRTGCFERVTENPLAGMILEREEWLCYPAKVGPLTIFVYFHQSFMALGCTLANLFDIASDVDIQAGPDAIYLFGAPVSHLARFGQSPILFFDDDRNGLLIGAVPGENRFGYFGYLKKMILTLHNIAIMKKGRMPFHGAMIRMVLQEGAGANILIIGDTAAGKSETLEALRMLAGASLQEASIIADDMGSLEIAQNGRIIGYGTEIGAFIRLDDLQQGYAFRQIDRAILMSPQKINARVVLPVTTLVEVLKGYPVDILLYANNYEEVDDSHPVIESCSTLEKALAVFKEGKVMAKGTTTTTGLNQSYFGNIFGPPQYRTLHDELAQKTFQAAFQSGTYVGQLRTRLAIPGFEMKGPEASAKALLILIRERHRG